MSSAHYFFRNYDIKQVINLLCYMTEFPHTLTSTQKITRLYRYRINHQDAYWEGKRNGQSVKIVVIQQTIIEISGSQERNFRLWPMYLKVLLNLEKLFNISRNESDKISIQLCSSMIRGNIQQPMDGSMFGRTNN